MGKKFYTEEDVYSWVSTANKNLKDKTIIDNGRVKVLKHYDKYNWFCKCHCGNIFLANPYNVERGATKSCGCTRGIKNTEQPTQVTRDKLEQTTPDYTILREGTSATSKWDFKCRVCNHKFSYAPSQLYGKRGRVPCKCSKSYRRSDSEWREELTSICQDKGYELLSISKGKSYSLNTEVYCRKHDHTWTCRAKRLLTGIGCNKCGEDTTGIKNKTITTEGAIKSFQDKHGDKFDYSLVDYTSWLDKLSIICPEHGIYYQTYYGHLKSDNGCPSCAKYGFKPKESAYLYLLTNEDKCKVGITNNSVEDRLQQINTSGKKSYKILKSILFSEGYTAKNYETFIIKSLGLPFGDEDSYNGSTEVTDISNLPKILEYIKSNIDEQDKTKKD